MMAPPQAQHQSSARCPAVATVHWTPISEESARLHSSHIGPWLQESVSDRYGNLKCPFELSIWDCDGYPARQLERM